MTNENPKNSSSCMSTFKVQPEPSTLITSLSWPWLGGEAEAVGICLSCSHPLFPLCSCVWLYVVEGWGGLFSISPGHLLELVPLCQESSGREEKSRKKICYCILSGVIWTMKVSGTMLWHALQVQQQPVG